MCINNTSHLIYPIRRSNNRKLFIGNTKFTLGRTKSANFNSAKTFKIANSQTLISANISSFTVIKIATIYGSHFSKWRQIKWRQCQTPIHVGL